jgi:hypothetical protein
LAAEDPATAQPAFMKHIVSSSIGRARPEHALQPIAATRFGLMSHSFTSMIRLGKAAQIQKGNTNVV